MLGHWLFFGIVLLSIFPGWVFIYQIITKNKKLSKEEKKTFGKNTIIISGFVVLVDCFYMTCFNRWDKASYVLGILLTLIVFYNLWSVFVSYKQRSKLEKWSSLLDFLVGIGVSVYLIYIVSDATLQTILTAIVAAVYGGMLTLAGVVLTIRWTNKQGEEQHKSAIRPFFYGSMHIQGHDGKSTPIGKVLGEVGNQQKCASLGLLENSDKVEFVIKELEVEGKRYPCTISNVVAKRELFEIHVYDTELAFKIPKGYKLIVENIDGETLCYQISLQPLKNRLLVTKIELLKEIR